MVFGYQGTCCEKRRMLPSLVGEKNRMEAQTQAPDHLCSAVQTDRQTQTTPPHPRPHVSAERLECRYGVVFTYRYTQNSHLNTTGSKKYMHTKTLQTHSSVLSSRTASVSGRGKKKYLRTPTAMERMRAYSLNYSSSSLKSELCAQILTLAPSPADKQLSTPCVGPACTLGLCPPSPCPSFPVSSWILFAFFSYFGFFNHFLYSHPFASTTSFRPKSGYTLTPHLRFGSSHFTQPR